MEINELLKRSVQADASDIFIIAGIPVTLKVGTGQQRLEETGRMLPAQTEELIRSIYRLARRDAAHLSDPCRDDDFSFMLSGVGRFRINVFHQRGSLSAVVRVIKFDLPSPDELELPKEVMQVAGFKKGLVLITGPAGSGKTTTLACILDAINHSRTGHIITLEDPLEYIHRHDRCIVSQREIYSDCDSFLSALRSALRESPDVILLGEMRDCETIEAAMTAAETGQLLFSSIHSTGAANTVDRIIDSFPANQQAQVRLQLSTVLQAVISQQLVPGLDGKLHPAFEIMYCNLAVRNLIRESKTFQMDTVIQSGASLGMRTMDQSLLDMVQKGVISSDTALTYCINHEAMQRKLK